MKVRAVKRGPCLGEVERVNHGYWFADAWRNSTGSLYTSLGAFRSKSLAVAAIHAWHADEPVFGRIPTQVLIGPPAGGMDPPFPEGAA